MINTSYFRLATWGRWMLSTVVSFIVGGFVGTGAAFLAVPLMNIFIPLLPLPGANTQGAIGYILLGCAITGAVVAGAVIGLFQWFVLQGWFERSRWWIGATAIGWTGIAVAITILTYTHVAGPVGQADGTFIETTVWDNAGAIAFSVSGVLVAAVLMGICQSLALRCPLSKALLWIAMNVAVFLMASAIMIFWVRGAGGMFGIPVFFAAYSPVYAAISGITILRLRASG